MRELDAWLAEQIAKGCGRESMVAAMRAAGHPHDAARLAVEAAWARRAAAPILAQPAIPAVSPRRLDPPRPIRQARVTLQSPRLMVFENFLSAEECAALVADTGSRMAQSVVVDPASGEFVPHPQRISQGTHFPRGATPQVAVIETRIEALLGYALNRQEAMQILRYPVGGEYRPHFDYFDPADPGSAAPMQQGGQRIATLVMYLNDVDAGGETDFPALGLRVAPAKGNAVYFESVNASGQPDPRTLHAGMPVLQGEKWIATKWFRERDIF